ncbi:MAG: hypothetical protein IKC13_06315 [Elusimicrobiaceae bacterium]|nr:hypothetical protein [Elusimicrobiaceae bacterium]
MILMLHFKRFISLTLSVLLLGQSVLWAQESTPRAVQEPRYTLAEYQAFAKRDLENTSWIQRHKNTLITIGGTTFAVGSVAAVLLKYQEKQLKEAAEKAMQQSLSQILAVKNEQLSVSAQHTKALHEQNRELIRENKALRKSNTAANYHLSQELKPAYERAYLENNMMKPLLEDLRLDMNLASRISVQDYIIDDYLKKIASSQLSKAQKMALVDEMSKKPWFKGLGTEAEQEAFTKLLRDVINTAELQTISTTRHVLATAISSNRKKLGVEFLSAGHKLLNHFFHSRNVLTIGLVVLLGVTSFDMQAQEMAQRVENNFMLFLNATPQELAIMEQNKEIREKCIIGAETINMLSQMPQEEALYFLSLMPRPATSAEKIKSANISNR